jgi:hypothetical protein
VRDLIFIALVAGFFAVASLFIRACELIVGRGSPTGEGRER